MTQQYIAIELVDALYSGNDSVPGYAINGQRGSVAFVTESEFVDTYLPVGDLTQYVPAVRNLIIEHALLQHHIAVYEQDPEAEAEQLHAMLTYRLSLRQRLDQHGVQLA